MKKLLACLFLLIGITVLSTSNAAPYKTTDKSLLKRELDSKIWYYSIQNDGYIIVLTCGTGGAAECYLL